MAWVWVKGMLFSGSGELGGAERTLLDLLLGLQRAGAGDLCLVVPAAGELQRAAARHGINVEVLPYLPALAMLGSTSHPVRSMMAVIPLIRAVLVYRRRARHLIRQHAPSIVVSNGVKAHILLAGIDLGRAPLVWHVHEYLSGRGLASSLLRRAARRCTLAVANSASVAHDTDRLLLGRVPIKIEYPGVDCTRFSRSGPRADLDALAGLPPAPPDVVRIGIVAAFSRWKGHETFLRALALLPADTPVRAYVIGAPMYQTSGSQVSREHLSALVRTLGLEGRVGFTGYLSEPENAYRALDIVVHASTRVEPFSLALAEAMASGCAVVMNPGGGIAELVTDGVEGLAHEPGDAASLAAVLLRLVADPDLRARLGGAAAAKIATRFSVDRYVRAMIETYKELPTETGE